MIPGEYIAEAGDRNEGRREIELESANRRSAHSGRLHFHFFEVIARCGSIAPAAFGMRLIFLRERGAL